jgi:hypothetical protein
MFVHDDGLGEARRLPEGEHLLQKMLAALKRLFEPDDLIFRPTDTTAYRAPLREDELRFGIERWNKRATSFSKVIEV